MEPIATCGGLGIKILAGPIPIERELGHAGEGHALLPVLAS